MLNAKRTEQLTMLVSSQFLVWVRADCTYGTYVTIPVALVYWTAGHCACKPVLDAEVPAPAQLLMSAYSLVHDVWRSSLLPAATA